MLKLWIPLIVVGLSDGLSVGVAPGSSLQQIAEGRED